MYARKTLIPLKATCRGSLWQRWTTNCKFDTGFLSDVRCQGASGLFRWMLPKRRLLPARLKATPTRLKSRRAKQWTTEDSTRNSCSASCSKARS